MGVERGDRRREALWGSNGHDNLPGEAAFFCLQILGFLLEFFITFCQHLSKGEVHFWLPNFNLPFWGGQILATFVPATLPSILGLQPHVNFGQFRLFPLWMLSILGHLRHFMPFLFRLEQYCLIQYARFDRCTGCVWAKRKCHSHCALLTSRMVREIKASVLS